MYPYALIDLHCDTLTALYGFFLEHGLSEEQASGILYGNAQRFFPENL